MSAVSVRPVQEADLEGYYDVRSVTYFNGDPVPPEWRVFKHSRGFVAEHEGQIKGTFNILDFTCTRGEALLKCGGVAGVAVLPHERRSGVGKAMMEYWIRQSREEGIHLASLYGFSERYYRQFGYEVCGKRIKITCPGLKLPVMQNGLKLRLLNPEDWQQIDACYQSFAHARSGLSMRNEKQWMRILSENRPLKIYVAGDPVEAYAVVSHKVDFWSTDHISEVGWSTAEGYAGLMEILRGLAVNKAALTWYEPSDSPFLTAHLDTKVEIAIDRPIMFRVCDVQAALSALRPEKFGQFSIRVRDELIPENEGPWGIAYIGDKLNVQRVDSGDLEIDIKHLAQAFLGDPSFTDLMRNGFVKVNNQEAIIPATRLFAPLPVYCPEFF
ncbi:MAG: enhanced intracellular survival protein Eis [Fimbriimonas sp.]